MTTTTYAIQVIHCGQPERVADLSQSVMGELLSIGLHTSVAVTVSETPPGPDTPAITVLYGSTTAANSPAVGAALAEAMRAGRVVIPAVDTLENYSAQVPAPLRGINGFALGGPDPHGRLARLLLEDLGIEDQERRVFISHKRDDGLGAAEQLHNRLGQCGFSPFIDRFAIREGNDVQRYIADALEDHAFLLLLETPLAHTSEWVYDEVEYALSHTMGTLIIQWPNNPTPVPGSQGLARISLAEEDLTTDEHDYQVLTEATLNQVVAEVEAAHARGLVRRRKNLVRNVEESVLATHGVRCVALPGWRLLVDVGGRRQVVGLSPRRPSARDLHRIDLARAEDGDSTSAVLVHAARVLGDNLKGHLDWVAGTRDLHLIPENAVGVWP